MLVVLSWWLDDVRCSMSMEWMMSSRLTFVFRGVCGRGKRRARVNTIKVQGGEKSGTSNLRLASSISMSIIRSTTVTLSFQSSRVTS